MPKPKISFAQRYKKDDITQGKKSVMDNVNRAKIIFVHEIGKMDNGDEYLIYKVVL